MPLRDHYRPPVWTKASWEGFHGGWPATIVQQLFPLLPESYTAEPRVHLGDYYEIDVCAFEGRASVAPVDVIASSGSAGTATATCAPPQPTFAVDDDLFDEYEYEVLIFDHNRGRQLVAAVEIVSPANKDRPESRNAFVSKCAALLKKGVCVSLVDLVTVRHFNLYDELLELVGHHDPAFAKSPPPTYAATCRRRRNGFKPRFETWAYPLSVGQALPTLPLWLTEDLMVSLDRETSYEAACRVLHISS
jgi:hypothetical protein